jgi:hypothetical protein
MTPPPDLLELRDSLEGIQATLRGNDVDEKTLTAAGDALSAIGSEIAGATEVEFLALADSPQTPAA